MADVEVIIKIPEVLYWAIKQNISTDSVYDAVKNGTLLPKGHGRIGDLDFLAKRIKYKPPIGEIGRVTLDEYYQEVLSADTIIEADREEQE